MNKGCVFNRLNFHLSFIKIAIEITMKKSVSEDGNINCYHPGDEKTQY